MTNSTLGEILTAYISYSQDWAIYAEKIDGRFAEESPARFGQTCFENGGLLDDCVIFCRNDLAVDALEEWMDGDRSMVAEAARELIDSVNNDEACPN